MKRIVLGLVFIFTIVAVHAKEKEETKPAEVDNTASVVVAGSVADENSGESLVGVEIKIEGTDLKTYTDFDGNFSFENMKPGAYKIVTNYISYQKDTKSLDVSSKNSEVKIKLQSFN